MNTLAPNPMDRRDFLERAYLAGLSLYGLGAASFAKWKKPRFHQYPFSLGVASGEPVPDGMILWTRLAPDPLNGGGLPPEEIDVRWEIASDEDFARVIRQGSVRASPDLAHSVHVEATNLESDRWYWYRFHAGDATSAVGKTRTTPRADSTPDRLDFVFTSCQHYEQGLYTGFEHLAREDVDLVFHLGDYIYESAGQSGRTRMHAGGELETLSDYRNRYAQYKTEASLQAAHAAFPWLVTWDDHEVDNNYAGSISENDDPVEAFLLRRAAAYQAYYEHMPLRPPAPSGPDMRLYRTSSFGRLVESLVLDTRQYRTDQPCGDRNKAPCRESLDSAATMLGDEQEQWLFREMERGPARWTILAQQVMMGHVDRQAGEGELYSMDQWSGYAAARDRLLHHFHQARIPNPVVLTGDIHTNWVNDLKLDFKDPDSPTVGTEFVGTSISSGGDGFARSPRTDAYLSENPFLKFFNAQRGYVRCQVTAEELRSDYRVLEYVSRPGSPISTVASFVVESGKPGATEI